MILVGAAAAPTMEGQALSQTYEDGVPQGVSHQLSGEISQFKSLPQEKGVVHFGALAKMVQKLQPEKTASEVSACPGRHS